MALPNATVPAIRIPLPVTYETFRHNTEKFPESTLTEGQIKAYCDLHASNPAEAWRVCPPEFYHYWEIHALAGVPLDLQEKGLTDEQAGEPDGYSEASGRGPIHSNTEVDRLRKGVAVKDAQLTLLREMAEMKERHEREIADARAEAAAKTRKEMEEEERRKALEKKNRSEAAKKAARTRRMDREIEEVAAKKAKHGEVTIATPIQAVPSPIWPPPALDLSGLAKEVASNIPLSQTKFLGPAFEARLKAQHGAPTQAEPASKKSRTEGPSAEGPASSEVTPEERVQMAHAIQASLDPAQQVVPRPPPSQGLAIREG